MGFRIQTLAWAIRDIYEAMQEHGIVGGTALGILSMFGMGVQTYEESK